MHQNFFIILLQFWEKRHNWVYPAHLATQQEKYIFSMKWASAIGGRSFPPYHGGKRAG